MAKRSSEVYLNHIVYMFDLFWFWLIFKYMYIIVVFCYCFHHNCKLKYVIRSNSSFKTYSLTTTCVYANKESVSLLNTVANVHLIVLVSVFTYKGITGDYEQDKLSNWFMKCVTVDESRDITYRSYKFLCNMKTITYIVMHSCQTFIKYYIIKINKLLITILKYGQCVF